MVMFGSITLDFTYSSLTTAIRLLDVLVLEDLLFLPLSQSLSLSQRFHRPKELLVCVSSSVLSPLLLSHLIVWGFR